MLRKDWDTAVLGTHAVHCNCVNAGVIAESTQLCLKMAGDTRWCMMCKKSAASSETHSVLSEQDTVGAMARTADDLILLDGIIRNSGANSTGNGAVYPAVQCAAPINASMSLKGVRLGLPSTFGWQTAGISQEVQTRRYRVRVQGEG